MKNILLSIFLLLSVNAFSQEKVGTLTAYYAKAGLQGYKAGQLIVDTNDPINRMVSLNDTYWKYEGDDTGEYYSQKFLKSKVTVKTYTMNQLPVSAVTNGATFISKRGLKVRIFWANSNGHKYYNWDGSEENWRATENHKECFVISGFLYSPYNGNGKWFFEDPLHEERGNIKLYQKSRFFEPKGVRYRPSKIGFIEEEWYNPESWGHEKSAYNSKGQLITDQWEVDGVPEYLSIAYIASEKALYINGELYYKQ